MPYIPPYPIVDPADLLPREQMTLNPERDLDPLSRAELRNLKRGTSLSYIYGDTLQAREAIHHKAVYFQMAAYQEGWEFDTERFKVSFLPIDSPEFADAADGYERRVYDCDGKVTGMRRHRESNIARWLSSAEAESIMDRGLEHFGEPPRKKVLPWRSRHP